MNQKNSGVIFLLLAAAVQLCGQQLTEISYQGRPHIEISTSTATYLFDIAGGGFSSIKDGQGREWIGFHTGNGRVPASAASDFRGLPNLVFQGSDHGAGHPGFSLCRSQMIAGNQILSTSLSGKWEWKWTFYDSWARLDVLRIDSSRNYWFLYEGIPGGRFDPSHQFWGNDREGIRHNAPAISSDDVAEGKWQWAYFGHEEVNTVFYVLQLDRDSIPDTFSYMGSTDQGIDADDGMVVFGFGRQGATPLLSGTHAFCIGFFRPEEGKGPIHQQIAREIEVAPGR